MSVPLGLEVSHLVPTFRCNCAHRLLKYSIGCNSCLFFIVHRKVGYQNIDDRQLSLSCPPVLHADGGAAQAELPLDQHVHCSYQLSLSCCRYAFVRQVFEHACDCDFFVHPKGRFQSIDGRQLSLSCPPVIRLMREHVGQQAAQPELLPHQHEELEGSSG